MTEILLLVVIVLLLVLQGTGVIVVFNQDGEIRERVRRFKPVLRNGLLCRLIGFIEEEDGVWPIFRPLLGWKRTRTGLILELNLGSFSLGMLFHSQFPFVRLTAVGKNEKLY